MILFITRGGFKMGMESISRVTAAQSYQANTAASQPAPVTNVETSDAVAQDKQTEVKSSQQSDKRAAARHLTIQRKMRQQ